MSKSTLCLLCLLCHSKCTSPTFKTASSLRPTRCPWSTSCSEPWRRCTLSTRKPRTSTALSTSVRWPSTSGMPWPWRRRLHLSHYISDVWRVCFLMFFCNCCACSFRRKRTSRCTTGSSSTAFSSGVGFSAACTPAMSSSLSSTRCAKSLLAPSSEFHLKPLLNFSSNFF